MSTQAATARGWRCRSTTVAARADTTARPRRARSCIVDCKNVLGEGALWCPREQQLWWIDISSPSLWRLESTSGHVKHWPLPKPPGCFALRKGGGFLFAFRSGFATLDKPGGELNWLEIGRAHV